MVRIQMNAIAEVTSLLAILGVERQGSATVRRFQRDRAKPKGIVEGSLNEKTYSWKNQLVLTGSVPRSFHSVASLPSVRMTREASRLLA